MNAQSTRPSGAVSRVSRKRRTAASALVVVLVGGGAAYAYWTAGGSGTGTAGTDDAVAAIQVVQTTTVAGLAPGTPPQALAGTLTNPNDGPVYVTSMTVAVSSVVDVLNQPIPGCSAADYTIAYASGTSIPLNKEALADDSTTWSGATIQFNNTTVNQDACKGATVNLVYTLV